MIKKAYMNWSSGKDSAMALFEAQQSNKLIVDRLFTSINASTNRVSMHGLHKNLLLTQSKAIGLPIDLLELPALPDMDQYNTLMKEQVDGLKRRGYKDCIFGDIFLEDLKRFREEQLDLVEVKPHFPLWKKDTKALMNQFFELGFRAVVVAASAKWFDQDFVGLELTPELINQLPKEVDPCGENGEFHTFCFDGPIFQKAVEFEIGESIYKTYPNPDKVGEEVGFWFCDLIA